MLSLLHLPGALAQPPAPEGVLASKFVAARSPGSGRPLRLLHAGDSHVAGGAFPSAVGELLGGVLGSPVQVQRNGVVGARADRVAGGELEALARLVRSGRPDMVLLTFGTNEARERALEPAAYEAAVGALLARIRAEAPGAAIVVAGPPEQERRLAGGGFVPVAGVATVAEAQARVARAAGAVYVDLSREMGGPGTLGRWAAARPPLVGPDRVHFTVEGYERLARLLVARLADLVNRHLPDVTRAARFDLPKERARASTVRPAAADRGAAPAGPASDLRVYREAGGRLVLTNLQSPPATPVLSRVER